MGRKVKVKVKTNTKRVKKQPIKPNLKPDSGILTEKIKVVVKKKPQK